MANIHFGQIGDVWKHLALADVVGIERPRRYWETHAGSADYPNTRSWEREYAVYRFFERAPDDPDLAGCAYLRILRRQAVAEGGPARYPGSALVAMDMLGDTATYLLCDLDPTSVASLDEAARGLDLSDTVRVVRADGLATVWEAAQALHGDASTTFVMVDPYDPLERSTDGMDAIDLLTRLAVGGFQVVLWYGYREPAEREALMARASEVTGVSVTAADLATSVIRGETTLDPGVPGCGLMMANLGTGAIDRVAFLGRALEGIYAGALMPDGTPGDLRFTLLGSD